MENNIAQATIKKKIAWGLKEKLFLLLIVSVLAAFVGQSFENTLHQVTPETKVFRSVVNKKASGHSALLAIANQSGLSCQVWPFPYRRLNEIKGLLYIIEPRTEWTEDSAKEVLAWVHQGNQLIYFDSFKNLDKNILLHKLGVSVKWLDNKAVTYDRNLPEMSHVNKLKLNAQVKLIGGRPIVACKDGAYITAINYGLGKILIGATPEICANEMLGKTSNYDNFQFMINCFRTANGVIFFDEYCHGIEDETNVFVYFSRRLPGLICLQLLFMLIPIQLSTGLRFGAIKTFKTGRKISDLAYVKGLANVYKRAQANLVALEIIVGFWRTKLCRQLGLSARASKDEILRAAKESNIGTMEQKQILDFLNDYDQALSTGDISKTRLTQLINQCDSLNIDMR